MNLVPYLTLNLYFLPAAGLPTFEASKKMSPDSYFSTLHNFLSIVLPYGSSMSNVKSIPAAFFPARTAVAKTTGAALLFEPGFLINSLPQHLIPVGAETLTFPKSCE